ncbi:MAG: hypothetical protein EOS78_26835 [Mesorhizobium sp.]|nr:hypothetical protein EJ077_21290 [Mesorhizobium sp. M8A.F.Ca.ET.057.01.1.1]RWE31075.1 MAG: hypothetical protein EOS78_26835 [Mesorhizobium sp.]RWE39703.1 MAG: hypothetical protein EOS80_31675 [Mesorhizobium sp.]
MSHSATGCTGLSLTKDPISGRPAPPREVRVISRLEKSTGGIPMKKTYEKPTLVKRERLNTVTAQVVVVVSGPVT